MMIRRLHARAIFKKIGDRWPILGSTSKKPDGWPGWPDGKQFAFVLTHDVEGKRGLDRVRRLAELEMSLGFRSSFNFIPEGSYVVPASLREWLVQNGFEVGVHDLQHNGKLYSSSKGFQRKAGRINSYLKDWNAVGFRSGFMLRNLEWLTELNIAYDSSSFDTDPFEPQPDGAGTVFPFWVPASVEGARPWKTNGSSDREGYIELPYTMPQDSTLFPVLQQRTPETWMKKLDWLAGVGGMALVNVHPDNLAFDGEIAATDTFPIEHYKALLNYVIERYSGSSWNVNACKVAAFASQFKPLAPRKPKRICMLAYSNYRSDARVTRYAETLAERGDDVSVYALRSSLKTPKNERINNVGIFSRECRPNKSEKVVAEYLFPVLRFFFTSMFSITWKHFRDPFDVLHIHNMPDFLVFAGWYPKLTGARVILDIHDIVPELYESKFGVKNGTLTIKLLKLVERFAARFANHVIISNHLWLKKFVERNGCMEKCSVFINNVDQRIFHRQPHARTDGRAIIMFPGGLQWHQGLDIALVAFKKIKQEFPNAEFHIYGQGNMKDSLVALTAELGLNGNVRFFEPLSVDEISRVMADADLGVVPKRADSFGNEAYSTKIMEFMSLGVPVVVSETKIDRFYFNDSVVRFFESGNAEALANAVIDVLRNPSLVREMVSRAFEYALHNSWDTRKPDYLKLVDSLCQ